jgi:hypothetical protein
MTTLPGVVNGRSAPGAVATDQPATSRTTPAPHAAARRRSGRERTSEAVMSAATSASASVGTA